MLNNMIINSDCKKLPFDNRQARVSYITQTVKSTIHTVLFHNIRKLRPSLIFIFTKSEKY